MKKQLLWYPVIIGVFGALIWFVLDKGQSLPVKQTTIVPAHPVSVLAVKSTWTQYLENFRHPLSLLLLQIVVIMFVARLFGKLANMVKQPAVVGEIIAGVLLGPSLLGWIAPSFSGFLFPTESMKTLQFLSQIGLAFFMFIVGMEVDLSKIRNKAHDAVMISHASIVVPFFLGVGLAYFIFEAFAPANVSFLAFALFMGIAMSITAFPVLARIVQERKLTGTPLGTLAITCAAADDITAWCILAVVVAIAQATGLVMAAITIGLAILFVAVMLLLVRPWLKNFITRQLQTNNEKTAAGAVFFTLLISGWIAEVIGIHALFGAFLAGAIMPVQETVRKLFTDKVEDVSVMILLPIFFVFTGLRTHIGLLSQGHLWAAFGMIMLVAVGGKFGGSAVTARLMGQTWRQSISIGALMNTRGLMELIVLNIGYDLGILSPEIFAMLVLMALATTFMTGPLLDLVDLSERKAHKAATA
ncbi:Kef-type K+ transport system, membrane component KefB [Chitinophaga jiangningensis]|uniref:Kef-type K+ transport system, membrane component KefB n=1 Tax=Chitinophaga jiangningensis TaxID=1419482 RepID=A0A1M7H0V3_9BACT|nr:cation:proton antiporter [Chitinophaga jiangningensis]SHM21993.1 Kef-type K+ transport system, membrane component KefB [Chitinophaga jiangningensis]